MSASPEATGRLARLRLAVLAATLALPWLGAAAAELPYSPGGARLQGQVQSFTDLRDRGVVKQRYDYSCGAAAVATLLTYGLGDPVGEREILDWILADLSSDAEALLRKQGLSLLDLRRAIEARNHQAQGFRVRPGQLSLLRRPVIVFIRPHGYGHFSVLKGVDGQHAYLADPSVGNWRMPLYRFLDIWLEGEERGVVLAVESGTDAWPESSPLELPASEGLPPEVLTLRQFTELRAPIRAPSRLPALAPDLSR